MALDFPKPVIEVMRVILYAMPNPHFQPLPSEMQSWKLFSLGKLIVCLSARWMLPIMIFQGVGRC